MFNCYHKEKKEREYAKTKENHGTFKEWGLCLLTADSQKNHISPIALQLTDGLTKWIIE